jgi:Fic family protein
VMTHEVVKSSAIEGETLNPAEVRSSIARHLGIDVGGLPKPSRDVEGIVEMMMDATGKFEAPLTKRRLFGWHAALFPTGRSGMNRIVVGGWRTPKSGPMQVVSGRLGRERVHFEAPRAERLEAEMAAFTRWFNEAPSTDPVIKAGIAHFWFVTIHPFEDGNGRIARAIADMALARADGAKERFYSMSAQIEAERKDYYTELEAAQKGAANITRWLLWFLGCLDRAIDAADLTLSEVIKKAKVWQSIGHISLNERQRRVINRLLDGFTGYMTTSKYASIAHCSRQTAFRDIHDLVFHGIMLPNSAGGRSTSYRLADSPRSV